ncbi:MAG: MFS transporter, partial [Neisseriaceae bacterium]|nr:MFS transporter [Neisseriaceae bacterium]
KFSRGWGCLGPLPGRLSPFFALGSVLAPFPVITLTRHWPRRRLFLLAIGGLLVFNAVTAWSGHYGVILAARLVAGMAAGVVWGLLAGYARRLVAPHLQGRALAIAGVGQPVALCLGVPLGAWLGTLFDWRGVFWVMSLLSLLLYVWVRLVVPDFAGQSAQQRLPLRRIFCLPGVRPILLTLFAWLLAHNLLYTYIAPFLASVGLGQRVDAVLLLFGVASIVGIWVTALWVDGWLRVLTLISLAGFAVAAVLMGFAGQATGWVLVGIAAWGVTFGGAPTLLQTALADTAGEGADVAQSMLVTIFNLAVAGGGLLGGLLLGGLGVDWFPWVAAALALLAFGLVWTARQYGFRSGARMAKP